MATVFCSSPCSGFSIQSQASYGPITAPQVTYMSLVETSTTDVFPIDPNATPPNNLIGNYGRPRLEGNSLNFFTPSFSAFTQGTASGPSIDITDGFLTSEIVAHENMYISGFHLREFGLISLLSPPTPNRPNGGSRLTLANTEAAAFLTIYEILVDDGTPGGSLVQIPNGIEITSNMTVSPIQVSPQGWDSLDDPGVLTWSGNIVVDIPAQLAAVSPNIANGLPILGATRLDYRMNNLLTAAAEDGFSSAFIDKKGIFIEPVVRMVPEPASFVLAVMSLLAVGLGLRRLRAG